ncbi:eCIS core domain-containing protein [Nostoc sp. DSM 114167]|uniref:eCIS core domain-containing protein n=1 Tax=Nostoc sp. DSM 114167 TaxID=3439050 RepID=UPI00404554F5
MREHVSRQKKTTTGFSIPSLKQPIPGFGLESSAISRQAIPKIQPLHKPVTHDISRISLRSQAKLSISQPGDKYEQEADSVAQQVMQRITQPVNHQSIHRETLPDSEELQMKPLANSITPLVQREALPEDEEELQMKSLDNRTLQREALPEDEEELQMKSLDNRTLQREALPEDEEELQMKSLDNRTLQRQEVPEDEEELQMKSLDNRTLQRQEVPEDEEELQMKSLDNRTLQREEVPEDEEELQMKSLDNRTLQREAVPEDEEELQMKPMVQRQTNAGMAATPDLEASINQARGGGQLMADNIREPMEAAFGADFSRVKVHTDGQSDQLNRSIQARAFTTGQDVFFRSGEYNPGSRGGQELLAHELTHVVQQNGGAVMRSPLPPQQLSQHTAIETPSASIADRTSQRKRAITGNSQISSLAQPGYLQMVPWNAANTTPVGSLSSSLSAGYALATTSPNARPPAPSWVTDRVAEDNPWNEDTERIVSENVALDAWNKLPVNAKARNDETTWRNARSEKDYNNRMNVHKNQWSINAQRRWLTASWNVSWNNNDGDLPGLAGAGGYAEYYAQPTGVIAAEGFWGRNRIVRDTTGAGPHANHWWATSDHYNNFTRII